ncbi:MAG: metallophosphoesterase [bacterium]|nr:metallophosphoesterase [bacterium]
MISRSEKSEQLIAEWKEEEKQKKRKKILKFFLIFWLSFLLLGLLLLGYMRFIGTKGLVVREYTIKSDKLPNSFHGFKILHFSDLHYLSTIHKSDLAKIITTVNRLKPDIIVFTGDLTDTSVNITSQDRNDMIELLKKMKATTGKYAIKGNHDYDNDIFEQVCKQSDFKILNNTYDLIYYYDHTPLLITGIGSSIKGDSDIGSSFSYSEQDSLYTISLLHEPDILDEILLTHKVDLALAGHSHNGQIRLPGKGALFTIKNARKYPNSYYKVENTHLYVSGGLGTSQYPLRFWNRPSINFYRLKVR